MSEGKVAKPYLFQKGRSGNPAGRPKGTKNRVTLMKVALELDLRTRLKHDAQEILDKAIDMAKNGDQAMIKLLIDKMIPTSKAIDDEPTKERVQVVISQLPSRDVVINGTSSKELIEEGEFSEQE